MIAVDATPLVTQPRTGVARALDQLLLGFQDLADAEPLVLLAPAPLGDAARGFEVHLHDGAPPRSPRAFRRALPGLVRQVHADVFLSPWSAFPALDVPTVVVVHELPFVRHGPLEGRRRTFAHRAWLRRAVARCAALITPSRATAEDLLALHPQARARVHVIPNAFDAAPWEACADAGDDAGARGRRCVMLGVGRDRRMARKKGLDVFLRACAAAGDGLQAVLVGRPALPLPRGVEVHAAADDAAVRRLLASAATLVYPSRSEGFGYPPLEAFAAGTPVVASDAGAIPEVVGDAADLVPAGDADALAAALVRSTRPDEDGARAARVRAGRERARLYPAHATARRVQTVLRAVRARA